MGYIYLDNSATTKTYKEVNEVIIRTLEENFGNPSSKHKLGITSEKAINKARESIYDFINKEKRSFEIVFTSGGTEANNMAIFSSAKKMRKRGKTIITSKVEHPSVLEPMKALEKEGFDVIYLDVDKKGCIDLEEYKKHISDDVILISIMTANNEVGTIMPIDEMYKIKPKDAIFHTDAVQAFGKIQLPKADIITASAHKIHGPKGVGFICMDRSLSLNPFILGGGQEKKFRSGTENTIGITGFGEAVRVNKETYSSKEIAKVKDYLKEGIQSNISDIRINSMEECLGNILNVSFLGVKSEVILHRLEDEDIFVSSGSACSSNKKGRSHVLVAMGLTDEETDGSIRFSLNQFNTIEEMDVVVEKLKTAIDSFRLLSKFRR